MYLLSTVNHQFFILSLAFVLLEMHRFSKIFVTGTCNIDYQPFQEKEESGQQDNMKIVVISM